MVSVRPAKKLPSLVKPRGQSAAPPTAKAALHPGDEFTGIYGCSFPVKYVKMIFIYIYMWTILCCYILYYLFYCFVLYSTVMGLYSTVTYYILLLRTKFYCYVLYSTVMYYITMYYIVLLCTGISIDP